MWKHVARMCQSKEATWQAGCVEVQKLIAYGCMSIDNSAEFMLI